MARIRITTDEAVEVKLKRQRIALAAQFAGAIAALLPEPCKHRDGRDLERCPKCAERRAVRAAADVVRETGGVQ